MSTPSQKIEAALSKDDQKILASFHCDPHRDSPNWENFWLLRQECREIYKTLIESNYIEEADYFKIIAEDCLGSLWYFDRPGWMDGEIQPINVSMMTDVDYEIYKKIIKLVEEQTDSLFDRSMLPQSLLLNEI